MFFINDLQIIYYYNNKVKAQELISSLKKVYKLYNLSNIKQFLGIQVIYNREAHKIQLVHNIYIKKIIKKFRLNSQKYLSTLLLRTKFTKNNRELVELSRVKVY